MDQLKNDAFYNQSMQIQVPNPPFTDFHQQQPLPSVSHPSQRPESEVKDCAAARKIQKADREKLRRDRLNEHFIELGNALDPDRPKNDKATILADTIQLLKDLTSQVNKLKAEYATLTEESRELTQEKNDLREEKASLKSDIENLNIQYQQRLRTMYPWIAMDHSVVMAPTSCPFPMPVTLPPGPIPLHPSMQAYPFYGNQNPAVIHNPCSTFVPFMTPNTLVDQQSTQHASSLAQPASGSHVSGKQDSKNKSSGESKIGKSLDCNDDVTTELELKTPGSTTDQDLSSGQRKSKKSQGKENSVTGGSSSSRCSSSRSVQDSSSNSMTGSTKADDLGR
ncbi:transcription factor bHLH121 isoform X2 [Hevea brasiliensis]|uniref:transcription factor bHLH121 isoform X2 n=1 Tax=Hevea brasiliensis TaxID=3981 RepID=UPI0025FE731F|nr:transcription factor bHLH121 isoform X2 [Hevea brasiliensis]